MYLPGTSSSRARLLLALRTTLAVGTVVLVHESRRIPTHCRTRGVSKTIMLLYASDVSIERATVFGTEFCTTSLYHGTEQQF